MSERERERGCNDTLAGMRLGQFNLKFVSSSSLWICLSIARQFGEHVYSLAMGTLRYLEVSLQSSWIIDLKVSMISLPPLPSSLPFPAEVSNLHIVLTRLSFTLAPSLANGNTDATRQQSTQVPRPRSDPLWTLDDSSTGSTKTQP